MESEADLQAWRDAAADFDKALAFHPLPAWLYVEARELYRHGPPGVRDPRRAIEVSEMQKRLHPTQTKYLTTQGMAYYRLEEYDKAIEALKKRVEIETRPGGANANYDEFFFLAMSHHRRDQPGDKAKGLAYYKQAVQNYEAFDQFVPQRPIARSNLPKAFFTARYERFRAEADQVLGKPPTTQP